jgi:hypothetical protein
MIEFLSGLMFFLFWFFIDLVGYVVARLTIPLLSFGHAYVHPYRSATGRFNWLGYRRDENGRIIVERENRRHCGVCHGRDRVFGDRAVGSLAAPIFAALLKS